ncbi:MAG: Asp-tRNA(Asn)/Glu-tRNA(Gln) amidotransferase subunit GatC [Lachnospiraceae bacterium]|nr:Asp-tRNA(Asn)/Glu-tRNA(Gln) amidotransferase subunit GatC [Lachnospiraceae bacterium]
MTDEVSRAAALAKIRLSEEEKLKAAEELKSMLSYLELLKTADVSGVGEDTETACEAELREDEAALGGMGAAITEAAPETFEDMFVVPRTV